MKTTENNEDLKIVVIVFLIFLIFPIGLAILFPEKEPPLKEREPIILPDEIGVDRGEFVPAKKVKKRVIKKSASLDWDDLRDIIENYSEDPYDVENQLEELRREQEQIKDLLRKYEKREVVRNSEKDFWTLKNREL